MTRHIRKVSAGFLVRSINLDIAESVTLEQRDHGRGTNAMQTNRNLKLSDDAWAESVPNLEIENNDVKCSHASAVGPVDPEQVFYLQSRGIDADQARLMIVNGFIEPFVRELPMEYAVEMNRLIELEMEGSVG